ncbi:fibronectin type III domain-containing protein [Streptoverticillium reticulum]|uniref:fibronectin type III domain-containing protein n=1 Tax=Streptoverticillium reticulum TaxID=1433415 RepID=UPI0039BF907A
MAKKNSNGNGQATTSPAQSTAAPPVTPIAKVRVERVAPTTHTVGTFPAGTKKAKDEGLTPGTTYGYEAWSIDAAGTESRVPARTKATTSAAPLLAPLLRNVDAKTKDGKVVVTWQPDPVSGIWDGWEVVWWHKWDVYEYGPHSARIEDPYARSYDIPVSETEGHRFYAHVRAWREGENSVWSRTNADVQEGDPELNLVPPVMVFKPIEFVADWTSRTDVHLSWGREQRGFIPDHWRVDAVRVDAGEDEAKIPSQENIAGLETQFTGLEPGREYEFTLFAHTKDNAQTSEGVEIRANTEEIPIPPPPTGLKVTTTATTSVSLEWDRSKSPDVTGYLLYWREPDATEWRAPVETTSTTATVTGLQPDTAYKFAVRAKVDDDRISGYSGQVKGTTSKLPIGVAKNVKVAATSSAGELKVTWDRTPDQREPKRWEVRWKKSSDGDDAWESSTTDDEHAFLIHPQPPQKPLEHVQYGVQVRGVDDDEQSIWSATVTGTPKETIVAPAAIKNFRQVGPLRYSREIFAWDSPDDHPFRVDVHYNDAKGKFIQGVMYPDNIERITTANAGDKLVAVAVNRDGKGGWLESPASNQITVKDESVQKFGGALVFSEGRQVRSMTSNTTASAKIRWDWGDGTVEESSPFKADATMHDVNHTYAAGTTDVIVTADDLGAQGADKIATSRLVWRINVKDRTVAVETVFGDDPRPKKPTNVTVTASGGKDYKTITVKWDRDAAATEDPAEWRIEVKIDDTTTHDWVDPWVIKRESKSGSERSFSFLTKLGALTKTTTARVRAWDSDTSASDWVVSPPAPVPASSESDGEATG